MSSNHIYRVVTPVAHLSYENDRHEANRVPRDLAAQGRTVGPIIPETAAANGRGGSLASVMRCLCPLLELGDFGKFA